MATTMQALWRRAGWIGLAGVVGFGVGAIAARTLIPAYQSSADVEFLNEVSNNTVQMYVASASIEAVLKTGAFVAEIERTHGIRLRRVWALPSGFDAVTVFVQGYGDPDRVSAAARTAAERAAASLVDTGFGRARDDFTARASRTPAGGWSSLLPAVEALFNAGLEGGRRQGRIDQQVADRVPAPIIKAARQWDDVPIRGVGAPSGPTLMKQRFALAGLLIGVGLAVLFFASLAAVARLRVETAAAVCATGL